MQTDAPRKAPPSPSALQARFDVLHALCDDQALELSYEAFECLRNWYLYASAYIQTHPEVGMYGSHRVYTDSHAFVIVEVLRGGKSILTQRMGARRLDDNGMSESQDYRYMLNPLGKLITFTWRPKARRWVAEGSDASEGGDTAVLGVPYAYHDYSF